MLLSIKSTSKIEEKKELSYTEYTQTHTDIHTTIYLLLLPTLQRRKDMLTMQSSPFSLFLFFSFLSIQQAN